ncbi:MAG TPA: ABC transporter permease [Thermoanaerobaculia bacterium]|nr:ABC transporter permease [Thermoanaerobaculia bacterium]
MRPSDVLTFTWRALSRHLLRTLLSLLGVAVGVTAVVLLTPLGEGARRYVVDQFAAIGSNLLIVVPGKVETTGAFPGVGGAPNDLTLADAEAIARQIPSARLLAPMAAGTESVAFGARSREVALIGTTATFLELRRLTVAQGRFLPEEEAGRGRPVAVLGRRLAEELFPGRSPLGEVIRVGEWRFRVIGVLAPKGTQLGVNVDEVVIVPVVTAMRMLNRTSLFRVMVSVAPGADLETVEKRVIELLAERHGEEDVTVLTQDSVVGAISGILNALNLAVAAIAAISLAVAGIGILNVMLVSVAERTGEIGLLKALGAGRRQILALFLVEAVALSSAGGLAGLAAGYAAAQATARLFPALPTSPPAWAVVAAGVLAVAVGGTFGYLPARRAARLEPVEALRGTA